MQRLRRAFYHFQHLLPRPRQGHPQSSRRSGRKGYRKALAALTLAAVLGSSQLSAIAKQILPHPASSIIILSQAANPATLFQQSQRLFEQGQAKDAVPLLRQAIQQYERSGNSLAQAIALGNLCLAHQQLGQWAQASQAIDQSLGLLAQTKADRRTQAGLLDIKASLLLDRGDAKQALTVWQQSEQNYRQLDDSEGLVRNRISQAQAMRHLGFYRRALEQLQTAPALLEAEPDSIAKSTRLRMLGDAMRLSGQMDAARKQLTQSLEMAETLKAPKAMSAAYLSLANVDRAEGSSQVGEKQTQLFEQAKTQYTKAEEFAPTLGDRLQIQTNQLSLLIAEGQWPEARQLWQTLRPAVSQLPSNRSGIYTKIHIAQNILEAAPQNLKIPFTELVPLLQTATTQAQQLGDERAESHAFGTLGHLYEISPRRTDEAIQLTQRALSLARKLDAADISYRLNWQMGRLLTRQDETDRAIAAYDAAIQDLQTLRRDLVAVNRDIQFSFRESVEPVYRESVSLLVKTDDKAQQKASNLNKARTRIEALQVAELDNFFREACLDGQTVLLDQLVDQESPNTAIIYPIILEDQLEVIVKLPGNDQLQRHRTDKSRDEVQSILRKLRLDLPQSDKTSEIKKGAKEVYSWLIDPFEAQFKNAAKDSEVDTLVFVLDGAFRNVPMGVLYDGEQYLIEKYALGVNLGLQLQAPKAIAEEQLNVLAAGLVNPPADYQRFAPLPGIVQEFEQLSATGLDNEQIFNQAFTRDALSERVQSDQFNVVHLATHGEFSSNAEQTFILAADGPVNVVELDGLLRNRSQSDDVAIELLVLSACQTAAGDDRAALGLAGVALKAGARSTLASLWNVNDDSTAALMGLFYQQLANDQVTKAEALRNAQRILLASEQYRYPSAWAPYIMVGNWL